MDSTPSQTFSLLRSWHDGDREALDHLLERELPFVRQFVANRMGPLLQAREEVDDLVQDAMAVALRYTPRFLVSDREQFRALLCRITENVLRDTVEKHQAKKRDASRERELPRDTLLHLDPSLSAPTRPSQAATRNEDRLWVRLAIDLLPPGDRDLVLWHEYDGMSFDEIAERLDTTKAAARMRFTRCLPRLAEKVQMLRRGDLGDALASTDDTTS
jgi:RNA polymerase sigma-70 factor, ECF subfamily